MAEPFTRPVLTANDLAAIVEGLNLYGQQWRDAADSAARNAVDEQGQMEAGSLLSIAIEVADLESRMRGLMDNLVNELIDRSMAQAMDEAQEDESLPTVEDEADIPLPEEDEVGTIPAFTVVE